MGRNNQSHFDRAPLHAVAPREDLEDEDDEEQVKDSENDGNLVESKANDDTLPTTNGTGGKTAGPPSSSYLPDSNGFQPSSTEGSGTLAETITTTNPVAGIPPSRFEIYPPIQPPVFKRRPGRPFGSKSAHNRISITPSTSRASGRGTPKKMSESASETPTANPSSTRRGRSSKLLDLPVEESTGAESNGNEAAQEQAAEITVDGQEAASLTGAPSEAGTKDTNHAEGGEEVTKANGTNNANDSMENTKPPEANQPSTPKGKSSDTTSRVPRSVNRKEPYLEKIQVVIPASSPSSSNENKMNGASVDGNA